MASSNWYCQIDGEEHGPLTAAQIKTMAEIGQLTRKSLVRRGDDGPWVPASRVKGVFEDQAIPTARIVEAASIPTARLVETVPTAALIEEIPIAPMFFEADPEPEPAWPVVDTSPRPAATTAKRPAGSAKMLPVRDVNDCISQEERKKRLGVMFTNGFFFLILIGLAIVSRGGLLIAYALGWMVNHLLAEYNVRKLQAFGTAASPDQFPEITQALADTCRHFGVREQPKVIVLNNPMLNAFAVKFARKRVIVLLSETLEGILDKPDQLRFIIGHELGHTMIDHGKRGLFELVKSPSYRAARELTCDNVGAVAAGGAPAAKEALKRLGVGNQLYDRLDESYLQAEARYIESGLTGWLLKSYMTYPPLGKRLKNVDTFARGKG